MAASLSQHDLAFISGDASRDVLHPSLLDVLTFDFCCHYPRYTCEPHDRRDDWPCAGSTLTSSPSKKDPSAQGSLPVGAPDSPFEQGPRVPPELMRNFLEFRDLHYFYHGLLRFVHDAYLSCRDQEMQTSEA